MIYLLFVLVALVSTTIVVFYCSQKGVLKPNFKNLNIYKKVNDVDPISDILLNLIIIICFVVSITLQMFLYKYTTVTNMLKLYILFILVLSAGLVDLKRKIIPNQLITFGLLFRLAVYCYEFIIKADIKSIITNDLIGFAIGFVLLAIVSILTKGAMGFGDVKLFGVIGIVSGSLCTYSTLFISLVLSALFSLIGICAKKINKKTVIPFGPFIALGYIITLFLTIY